MQKNFVPSSYRDVQLLRSLTQISLDLEAPTFLVQQHSLLSERFSFFMNFTHSCWCRVLGFSQVQELFSLVVHFLFACKTLRKIFSALAMENSFRRTKSLSLIFVQL